MHLPSNAPSAPPDPDGRLSIEQLLESQPILSKQVLIICLCFAVAAFDGLDLAIMGFIAPALRGEWHLSPPQMGTLFSGGLIGLAIGALTAGPAADRLGRKRVLILAVTVFGTMCVASAFARNPQDLLILRILTGLGLGAAAPNAITLTSEYTPARRRSSMVTTMFCGFNLGSALGGLAIVPLLLPHVGWRGVLVFIGLLPVLLVPFLTLLPESLKYLATRVGDRPKMDAILRRVFPNFQGDSQAIVIAPETKREASAVSGLFTAQLRGCTFLLWPVFFMNLLVIYLISNWLPTVIKDSGFSTTMASVIVSSFQIGGMLGSFSIGYIMDRRRPESVILAVYLLGAVSTAALGFAYFSPALLAVCIFVVGITVSGGMTGIIALTSQIYPTASRATGVSWAMGIGRVGSIIGSTVGAWLFSSMFTFQTAFLLVAAPSVFIALGIVLLGRLRVALAAQAAQAAPASGLAGVRASVGLLAPLVGLGLIACGASTARAQSAPDTQNSAANPAPAVREATGNRGGTVTDVINSDIAGPLIIPFTLLRAPAKALYTLAHEDEDFRYLADPKNHNDLFDATRYIPLPGIDKPQFFLSLGADLRATYEVTDHDGFGTGPDARPDFTFIRLLGYADLHLGEHFRIFGELIYSDESGRAGGPSPVERDDGDLDQAFAEVAFNLGKPDGPMPAPVNVAGGLVDPKQNSISLRVGRQEIAFGDERLFSIHEGLSIRIPLDMVRATIRVKPFQLDLFGGRVDNQSPGTFDDDPSTLEEYAWGAYLTTFALDKKPVLSKNLRLTANLDLYYFGTYQDSTVFNYNEGGQFDHRNTVGGRVWGRFDLGNPNGAASPLVPQANGERPAQDGKDGGKTVAAAPSPKRTPDTIDYNFDGAYQFGKFGHGDDIDAFMFAFDSGYTWQGIKPRPRIGFEFQISSGDKRAGDGENNTFNSLEESGNRYGALYDNQQVGPANAITLRPEFSFDVTSRLQFAFLYLLDWRYSLNDGVYGIPGQPVLAPVPTDRARFVTDAPEVRLRYSFDRHTTLTLNYSRYNAGAFVKDQGGKSVDSFAAAIQIKF